MSDLDVLNEPLSADDMKLAEEGYDDLVNHNRSVFAKARNSSGGESMSMPDVEEDSDGCVVINGVKYKKIA